MLFQTAGIQIDFWIPPLVAFGISFFHLHGRGFGRLFAPSLPGFFLGYTHPSVSATNQLFNVVANPSGVYRYWKEGRMVWPLTAVVVIGTLPGVFIGAFVRVAFLPDPTHFKLFAAGVLFYIGLKMVRDLLRKNSKTGGKESAEKQFQEVVHRHRAKKSTPDRASAAKLKTVQVTHFNLKRLGYTFCGQAIKVSFWGILALSFIVGIVGGTYGIGGGAIITPFFVTVFGLPVHTVAGAALMGTFVTSVAGVAFYQLIAPFYPHLSVAPGLAAGMLVRRGRDGGNVPRGPVPEVRSGPNDQVDAGNDHHCHRLQVRGRLFRRLSRGCTLPGQRYPALRISTFCATIAASKTLPPARRAPLPNPHMDAILVFKALMMGWVGAVWPDRWKKSTVTGAPGTLFIREHPDLMGLHPKPLTDHEGDVGDQFEGDMRVVRIDFLITFKRQPVKLRIRLGPYVGGSRVAVKQRHFSDDRAGAQGEKPPLAFAAWQVQADPHHTVGSASVGRDRFAPH